MLPERVRISTVGAPFGGRPSPPRRTGISLRTEPLLLSASRKKRLLASNAMRTVPLRTLIVCGPQISPS